MITITENTAVKVAALKTEQGIDLPLRVFVQGGGCSGMQYGFAFEETQAEDDFEFSQSGVKFLIDAMSMQYLTGAVIDYREDFEGSNFVIKNPNAQTSCGCGSSFGV